MQKGIPKPENRLTKESPKRNNEWHASNFGLWTLDSSHSPFLSFRARPESPRLKYWILILLCWLHTGLLRAEDRIWISATVNHKPARLVFDTGCPSYFMLFRPGAQRLGVIVTNVLDHPDDTNGLSGGYTPLYSVKVGRDKFKAGFIVLDTPLPASALPGDGLIGWPYASNCILRVDALKATIQPLRRVPPETKDWLKIPIQRDAEYLRLLVPGPNGSNSVVVIDTGFPGGIRLRPVAWSAWLAAHTNAPVSLSAGFNFGPGITSGKEAWAKEFKLGPLKLTGVPVTQANAVDFMLGGDGFEATIGMAALKRMDVVIDAIKGFAYLRLRNDPPPHYELNRLGAEFLPDKSGTNFVAQVLTNGPAFTAGIRDGDLLLKAGTNRIATFGDLVEAGLRSKKQPTGSTQTFTLRRGTNVFEAGVVLKDVMER